MKLRSRSLKTPASAALYEVEVKVIENPSISSTA
jgi:hypothetical protein